MNDRPSNKTSLIRSKTTLRALVTGITFTTFTGMSAFAASHIQNSAAPLQPTADGTNAAATATPAPTARTRTTITNQVPTTTAAPRTRTRRS
ncbi:MAG TPA: hypothetical protein VI814_09875 [Candidatus Limnocylindria bacterium]